MLEWAKNITKVQFSYSSNAKVSTALRVDFARLEEGLARGRGWGSSRGGNDNGGADHDGDNSGFEELHFWKGGFVRGVVE